jgi:hypothetical protein
MDFPIKNTDTVRLIGSLSAHIPGDHRYTDHLKVFYQQDGSLQIGSH